MAQPTKKLLRRAMIVKQINFKQGQIITVKLMSNILQKLYIYKGGFISKERFKEKYNIIEEKEKF